MHVPNKCTCTCGFLRIFLCICNLCMQACKCVPDNMGIVKISWSDSVAELLRNLRSLLNHLQQGKSLANCKTCKAM